jgi:hypothetical protein
MNLYITSHNFVLYFCVNFDEWTRTRLRGVEEDEAELQQRSERIKADGNRIWRCF